ncbi:RDD family protein [Cellulomonas sp. PhB143]|uniref:RDD family protein n=1 Tax=Cellulomonas sp. PhB143 TaxID=2485186 RepID=UPI000F48CA7E|nr:RDD family protein [Cellulomonas sp. PhB143]ROS73050.1 putative RDD family membrane protein YckC [Cellulomonas sp. PhB143]
MASREDIGSWLEGAPQGSGDGHRGERLGLPAHGPGALAPTGARVVALLIDWVLATLIAYVVLGARGSLLDVDAAAQLVTFALVTLVLVATVGTTIGHRLLGMRVRVLDGRPSVGLRRALVRTLLLCLVVPAVVWDRDGRGVHDRAAGTVLVRTR